MPFLQKASCPLDWIGSHPYRFFFALVKTVFVAHAFAEYGYAAIPVQGASMVPTFEVFGDFLVVSKHCRRGRDVQVGDVVQFDHLEKPGAGAVKRVLGLEGDYVLRNSPGARFDDMIQVPQGHCWVVGDNLPYSNDSRHYGPLPMALIRGKVIAKAFPWKERRWVINPLESQEAEGGHPHPE